MELLNKNEKVDIVFHGFKNLGTKEDAEFFFQRFCRISKILIPQKIGTHEPLRNDFTLESAQKVWVDSTNSQGYGGVLFKGKTVRDFFGYVWWRPDNSNIISIQLSIKYCSSGINNLLNFVKEIFVWANCVYGYGYHSSQDNIHYTPGLSYQVCLGGITWMALLGKPYVTMFGKDIIQSAPCIVEEFADDSFILLTSEKPVIPDDEILLRQQRVKSHLGEDAFFRGVTQWSFSPEEVLAGKHLITSEEGYRSPDFSLYGKR